MAAKKKHPSGKTAPAQKTTAATGKKQAKQPAPHKTPAPHKSPKKPKSPAAAKRSKTLAAADRRKDRAKARRAAPAYALHDAPEGHWVTGGNLTGPSCAATAAANSLLVCTGYRATEADVLMLASLSRADGEGVSVYDTLATANLFGLAGWTPEFEPADELEDGVIAGAAGTHAVVSAPAGLISWGGILPDWWELDGELWRVKWRR